MELGFSFFTVAIIILVLYLLSSIKILAEYERMIPEFGLTVVDATLPIEIQQAQVRRIAKAHLDAAKELRVRP